MPKARRKRAAKKSRYTAKTADKHVLYQLAVQAPETEVDFLNGWFKKIRGKKPLSLREDWMAKLQHQRLGQTILDAAATLGRSDIHGLHPVPGMAYGAEFGLNKETIKSKPSLQHLQDVAGHKY